MHRAAVRNLHQPFTLALIQRTVDLDFPADLVDEAYLRLAIGAVFGMDPAMVERYPHPFERPTFALGIQTQRHGGAGAKRRQQQVVRVGSGAEAAGGNRLIGEEAVAAGVDLLLDTTAA